MEVGQDRVQTGSSNGADSARPSSPSPQLAETWGERFGEALLNGGGTITTDELPNNSHFLETDDRELEIKKLRDKLRSSRAKEKASRAKERASKTRERASRAREEGRAKRLQQASWRCTLEPILPGAGRAC